MQKLASLLYLLFAGALTTHAQGVLSFDRDAHDFGNVPEGTMASHEFKFKNTGCNRTPPSW